MNRSLHAPGRRERMISCRSEQTPPPGPLRANDSLDDQARDGRPLEWHLRSAAWFERDRSIGIFSEPSKQSGSAAQRTAPGQPEVRDPRRRDLTPELQRPVESAT